MRKCKPWYNQVEGAAHTALEVILEMTVERTGHVHRATVKPLREVKRTFWGPRYFRAGPTFCARAPPACPSWGEGQNSQMPVGATLFLSAVRETQFNLPRPSFSVPCVRPNSTCRVFSTILRIVVHDFARQLFDQLLADHAILAGS